MIDALRPDFGVLFAVAAPFTLLVSMALALFGPAPPTTMAALTPRVVILLLVLPSIVGAIGQLAVTWLVANPGGTPRQALAVAARVLPAYLGALLLATPATSLGLIALILPGLYIFARVFLIGPAAVIEGLGPVAALRRSWAMTATSAWTILAFIIVGLLFMFGAAVLSSGVGAALGLLLTTLGLKSVGGFVGALIGAVVSTLFAMGSAAAGAVVFQRLR
ncbi:glycerophosphoryl diester phosphodiesterase membrane domain-containing protein [Polymorphobacter fuscus]|uniref:Glycerophosphoryl diester phosphodiesterase membrane domain-containing protein n=1 Tax=Sandarakinorhabdus fusca TaxID=1439888 RepID=A0A7C9LHU5_9SPHN|nr:glycerophosphoryl diester phosphodiesterase membrane domain-containing protein [Polymorphobacter fuscus]KAB7644103.1 hypothetical protein F9290_14630 [Polymorphobacter fuscus]MQT18487.1 hypothetical protein [Polymorphobacter fuscus]NJC08392.1 hypothetical protein [Polymorphobacter fuscus]